MLADAGEYEMVNGVKHSMSVATASDLTAGRAAAVGDLPDISDRQFARGLWGDGIITYTDFLSFIGPGTIPAALQAIISTLPDDDTGAPTPRKDAVGFLTGAKTYQFEHPLVEAVRQVMFASDARWTPEFLRSRWLMWADL